MAKVKKAYFCKECGYEAPKWMGRCPACGEWNTFTEEIVARESGSVPAAMTSALPRSTPQRVGEIRDEIHRTDPAAEGARAQDRVEDEDDHGSEKRRALREVSRKEALEKRERVRERNRPENERARKISRKELFPRDGPAPAGRSDEGEKHQNLHEVAGKTEAVSVQPFAPGLGGRQMTNFGLHGSTSWLR